MNTTSLPDADAILPWARQLYQEGVDKKDAVAFAAAFTDEGTIRFGNAEQICGRAAIEAAIAYFFTTFASLKHDSRGAWLQDDTLVLEANVTYHRHDELEVTVPAVTIFHLVGRDTNSPDKILADDCRIYVDLGPLYAPAAGS